jgi:hypothetical protein
MIKNNLKPLSFIDVNQDAYVTALLGVYEKNDVSLLVDLYIWAYQRSTLRYSATQQSLGEPNLLKLKYREVIHDIVRTIILEKSDDSQVMSRIQSLVEAHGFSDTDVSLLIQAIETEIVSLHERNVVRYKIRPSEFQAWKKRSRRN